MRIHPIRDSVELHPFPVYGPAAVAPCPSHERERKLPTVDFRKLSTCKLADPDVNRILLKRAFAGLLSRLRTFDWQVIHGHQVGGSAKRGTSLDVHA